MSEYDIVSRDVIRVNGRRGPVMFKTYTMRQSTGDAQEHFMNCAEDFLGRASYAFDWKPGAVGFANLYAAEDGGRLIPGASFVVLGTGNEENPVTNGQNYESGKSTQIGGDAIRCLKEVAIFGREADLLFSMLKDGRVSIGGDFDAYLQEFAYPLEA